MTLFLYVIGKFTFKSLLQDVLPWWELTKCVWRKIHKLCLLTFIEQLEINPAFIISTIVTEHVHCTWDYLSAGDPEYGGDMAGM